MINSKITLREDKKVYFASDFHLSNDRDIAREKKIFDWLDGIKDDAQVIFLLGDVFDFWFEYKYVVPRGNIRLLGKIAELSDHGISIYFFLGNHDLWMRDYLEDELGVHVIKHPISVEIADKLFFLSHGDGLNLADFKYKLIKWVFLNPSFQWLFGWVHPTVGFALARFWSSVSREGELKRAEELKVQMAYCRKLQARQHHDFYILGDCHQPVQHNLDPNSEYVNLGDWISHFSYAVFDGRKTVLKFFGKHQ